MTATGTNDGFYESWQITKPVISSRGGLVASQHYRASRVGADVLTSGGNAVDAAVAAGFAIGAVEPWMSGLGGGGHMLVYLADEGRAYTVDFAMQAPRALDPADYPLVAGRDSDLFEWPAVHDDRNVHGPLSIAVPGFAAGMAAALERFGSHTFDQALAPAIAIAGEDLVVDWYATLKIASGAATLARYPDSARVYLPGGTVPAGAWGGPLPRITLTNLARTFSRLAAAGAEDFYHGELARALVDDARAVGAKLNVEDLTGYRVAINRAERFDYRGAGIYVAPRLTAGPTLCDALGRLEKTLTPAAKPDAASYAAYAKALMAAYETRLAALGDVDDVAEPACTTHLSVVDRDGNMVALTQTLLSVFGSKVVFPSSGVLMNNGVMWFDPRPGRPNSIAAGRRPLSNMCPTIVERDGVRYAMGASGGRRIMPSVFQLISFLIDFDMSLNDAMHAPRIDVSGGPTVAVDRRLDARVVKEIELAYPTECVQHGVYPALFACPNVVARDTAKQQNQGGAFVMSPWSEVAPSSGLER